MRRPTSVDTSILYSKRLAKSEKHVQFSPPSQVPTARASFFVTGNGPELRTRFARFRIDDSSYL
jgi:hypothetical protein